MSQSKCIYFQLTDSTIYLCNYFMCQYPFLCIITQCDELLFAKRGSLVLRINLRLCARAYCFISFSFFHFFSPMCTLMRWIFCSRSKLMVHVLSFSNLLFSSLNGCSSLHLSPFPQLIFAFSYFLPLCVGFYFEYFDPIKKTRIKNASS